jgi:hypothetical protein
MEGWHCFWRAVLCENKKENIYWNIGNHNEYYEAIHTPRICETASMLLNVIRKISDYNSGRYSSYAEITWAFCQYMVSTKKGHDFGDVLKIEIFFRCHYKKINSMVWVRERTTPTERPPLVGEVIANFCGWRVPRGQRESSLRTYSRFSWQGPLFFYQVAPQLHSQGWVDPVPDPLLYFLVVPGIELGPPDL